MMESLLNKAVILNGLKYPVRGYAAAGKKVYLIWVGKGKNEIAITGAQLARVKICNM